jgi:AbrB family looped-hinge helix DNA binding protein
MTKTATITSKRQITIPAALFKEVGLAERQKVLISEEEGKLVITPIVNLIERLSGSLQVPSRWKGKDIDTIIEESKAEYFSKEKRK